MNVRFVDTCILMNLLDIPGRNQNMQDVKLQYELAVSAGDSFVLPLATIIETGNHISHIDDGALRRGIAIKFAELIKAAHQLKNNWSLLPQFSNKELDAIISKFPDQVIRHTGIGDVSIIEQFEWYWENRQPIGRIIIWSLDGHLSGYIHEGGLARRIEK